MEREEGGIGGETEKWGEGGMRESGMRKMEKGPE